MSETQQDLENVEQTMQDTAESAGDSAEQLEGFSQQFAGAMSAAVAALAVGAAGLMSQVPVLGEAFSGLGAIVDALALKMDQFLRSIGAGGLTTALFNLANAIYETDGAAGQLVGGITTIASVLAIAIPAVAKIGAIMGTWSSTLAGVQAILTSMGSTLTSVISTLAGFVSGSAAAVAAVGALIGVLSVAVLEVTGVMDAVRGLGQMVGQALPQWVTDGLLALTTVFLAQFAVIGGLINGFVQGTLEGGLREGVDRAISRAIAVFDVFAGAWGRTISRVARLISNLLAAFTNLGGDLAEWANGVAENAYEWGRDIVQQLIAGIDSLISELRSRLQGLQDIAPSVNISLPSFGGLGGGGGGGGGGSGAGRSGAAGGIDRFRSTGTGSSGTTIDGRQLSESTGRYRSDPGRRRGL